MIEKWLDAYELKARDVPGLILVFPIIIDALYVAPILTSWPVFAASGICCFALIYALGQLARAHGEQIEANLWASWDGPPSTRFMRHRDTFFGVNLKELIRRSLTSELSAPLLTAEEELADPARADKEIEDAFKQVRPYLRANDSKGLWYWHNIEYGFSRNLLGSRVFWVIVSAAATAFAVLAGLKTGKGFLNPASTLDFLALLCSVYIGWWILPGATKRIADGYAEAAWLAFLRKTEERASVAATVGAEKGKYGFRD